MLEVRQRRAPVATPFLHVMSGMGSAGQEDMERDREGVWGGAPAHSLGQASVGWAGYGGSFRIFAHDEDRVHRGGKSIPGGGGRGQRGRGGGAGPSLDSNFPSSFLCLSFFWCKISGSLFLCLSFGVLESPTMTGQAGLGQDMVI